MKSSDDIDDSLRLPRTWRGLSLCLLLMGLVLAVGDMALGVALDYAKQRVWVGQKLGRINYVLAQRPEILVVGSSRAAHHFDDNVITRRLGRTALNAGFDGQGVLFALGLFDLISARGAHPELVLCDITTNDDEAQRIHTLDPWYGEDPALDDLLIDGDWRNRVALTSSAYRYANCVLPLVLNYGRPPPTTGFLPLAPKAGTSGALILQSSKRAILPEQVDQQARNLVRLIQAVRASGGRIVLIESPRFRTGTSLEVEAALKAAQETETPFWQFNRSTFPEFADARWFVDDSHLTAEGARWFTEKLCDRLLQSGLLPELGSSVSRR